MNALFVLQKEQFTKAVSSKSIRLFLEWFVETQMFEVFITERLTEGEPNPGRCTLCGLLTVQGKQGK